MVMPDSVKLGRRVYTIEIAKSRETSDGTIWGEIDYERNIIYLNEDSHHDTLCSTLLHEIIHWIFFNAGNSEWRRNEGLVECLAENLVTVFQDNPDLAKQLFSQE